MTETNLGLPALHLGVAEHRVEAPQQCGRRVDLGLQCCCAGENVSRAAVSQIGGQNGQLRLVGYRLDTGLGEPVESLGEQRAGDARSSGVDLEATQPQLAPGGRAR